MENEPKIQDQAAAPTWDGAATLARAAATLMTDSDLSHDLLVELAAPIVRRLAAMVAILETDPHGDSDRHRGQWGPPLSSPIMVSPTRGDG